jgi:hypothetical protein
MKLAPIVAGGALGLLMLALASAKSPNPPDIRQPLETAGIRTLHVQSRNPIEVEVAKDEAHLSFADSTEAHVRARRDGDRLIVVADLESWETLKLVVPPSVERFVVDQGEISTKLQLGEIEILSPGDVSWHGDARRVVLRDTSDPSKHRNDGKEHGDGEGDCSCSRHSTLSVSGGKVGELRAYSPHATLKLGDADNIGVAYAWIGPKGNISIDTARNFQQVHLMKEGEAAP